MEKSFTNLFGFDRKGLERFFQSKGERPFRAKQLLQWLYQRNVKDVTLMTDLSKPLRQMLAQQSTAVLPEIVSEKNSADGTTKWLLRLDDGNCVETVYIPESSRGTLCVSSQVGCGLNCTFCATAKQGFNRNLRTEEIITQLWVANNRLAERKNHTNEVKQPTDRHVITNVVMMGMGEPLLNMEAVIPAMNLMLDDFAYGLSKRRVTLSTAGMVPAIERLKRECPISLAISLHAPENGLRNQLVPLNKKYPIEVLLEACKDYVGEQNRQRITFEYVMLKGVNDSISHAKKLAKLLSDVPAKINLIPFNSFDNTDFVCSDSRTIDAFRYALLSRNIFATTRKTRGNEIDAACGQLAGKFVDKTGRSRHYQSLKVVRPVGSFSASV